MDSNSGFEYSSTSVYSRNLHSASTFAMNKESESKVLTSNSGRNLKEPNLSEARRTLTNVVSSTPAPDRRNNGTQNRFTRISSFIKNTSLTDVSVIRHVVNRIDETKSHQSDLNTNLKCTRDIEVSRLPDKQKLKISSSELKIKSGIAKLNRLRDLYVSKIPQLPHPTQSAAAIVSSASRRIPSTQFHYSTKIESKEKPVSAVRKSQLPQILKKVDSITNILKLPNSKVPGIAPKGTSTQTWEDYVDRTDSPSKLQRNDKRGLNHRTSQTHIPKLNIPDLLNKHQYIGQKTDVLNNCPVVVDTKTKQFTVESSRLYNTTSLVPSLKSPLNTTFGSWLDKLDDSNGSESSVTAKREFEELWSAPGGLWVESEIALCLNGIKGDLPYMQSTQLNSVLRAHVVNWLVKLDDYMSGSGVVLQSSVQLFDAMGARGALPAGAQLVAAACYWLAAKHQSARTRGASSLVRHSLRAFSARDLLACERLVLRALDFPPAPRVPAYEVERLAAITRATKEVRSAAHYLCCCALLHAPLAATPPVALAAAALSTSTRLLESARFLNTQGGRYAVPVTSLERTLEAVGRAVSRPTCAVREPFLLYSSLQHCAASVLLDVAFHKTPAP